MTRHYMVDKLLAFLRERIAEPATAALLADGAACRAFWWPLLDRWGPLTEHALAVRMTFALAARASGGEGGLADAPGEDAETAMKVRLEQRGLLPFGAFD